MLTPGPDMLFCLASGLKGGPRSGLLAATGAATGEVVHSSTAAVGLAAMFRAAPLLFDTVRLLGAAYLLLLGIRAFHHRHQDLAAGNQACTTANRPPRRRR